MKPGGEKRWDRAAHRRTDEAWLQNARKAPESWVLPVWRSKNLLDESGAPKWLRLSEHDALANAEDVIFLGVVEGAAVFTLDLSHVEQPELPGKFVDLRRAGMFMPPTDFGPLAYARGMARWHRVTRFCTECGGALRFAEGGFARGCTQCETIVYPRTDPAVMVLITRGDACLLARQPRFPKGMYSALAGFVEVGESIEQCVERETLEEVGLEVTDVRYVASQAWPFPQSLMIGFRAVSTEGEVVLDDQELEEARWFTRAELKKPKGFFYPPPMSLAHRLIQEFVGE